MYERVLFPTDGSEGAGVATEHAMALAEEFEAPIHVLYVVDITAAQGTDAFSGVAIETLETAGEEQVQAVEERASEAGIDVTSDVVEGTPASAIVEEAVDGDVVVMGTHGRTGLDRYLIGSTTEKVVRTSDVPVVTIPIGDVEEPERFE